jgi:glycosyltransferase involved in cell wall biosynthesis
VPNELASWALPIRVLDLVIAAGVEDITDCAGYGGVRALIRRRGVPLGWIDLSRAANGTIPRNEVVAAVRYLLEGAVRRAHAADAMQPASVQSVGDRLPPISVVVCTRDRPDLLARCLESIRKVDYTDYEVVVVDNASKSNDTREVAERAGVRCVREERPGLDSARNRGIASTRHAIIVFTDDDVEVDPLWLRRIAAGFEDPTVQCVSGFVMPARMDTEAELLFELCYDGMGKGTRPRRWDPARMKRRELIGAHHVGIGANMAFRRTLLDSLGGFDPALDVGTASHGGGDLDILHRALMQGAVVRYESSAIVRHYHRRDMQALKRQHYDNGRAFGVYLLTILRRGDIPRHVTLWYSMRIWLAWYVGRLIKRMLKRDTLPAPLLISELWGACHAPWAYFATYAQMRSRDRVFGRLGVQKG